jgi:large subunit ribosomal protein L5
MAAKTAARLREKYHSELKPALQKELGLENPMAVPRLEKIVLNMGLGEATQNVKIMDPLVADLSSIAGQKPVTTRAKKSIAAFKVREGMPIGTSSWTG